MTFTCPRCDLTNLPNPHIRADDCLRDLNARLARIHPRCDPMHPKRRMRLAIEKAAVKYHVSVAEAEVSRRRQAVAARAEAMRELRDEGWSLLKLAAYFECHHTTVHHLLRRSGRPETSDARSR